MNSPTKLLVFIFSLLFVSTVGAQTGDVMAEIEGQPYVVPGARVHQLQSEIVAGQIYDIRVAVPGDYQSSPDKEYPVIYVLDGQWNFTITADITGKISYDGMIPEVIIAAITWGGEGDDPNQLRTRDFTISQNPYIPLSGGAQAFLGALTEELVPYVESLYRASGERVLTGSSLGGLFTSYAMFEKPDFFGNYVALAAPYVLEQEYFDSKMTQYAHEGALAGVRLYLGVGALDGNKALVEGFSESLDRLRLCGLKKRLHIVDGVGHAGVEPIGYTHGFQFAFARPQLSLSKQFLRRYEGTYAAGGDELILSVIAEHGHLRLEEGDEGVYEFYASSPTDFYVKGADFTLTFSETDEGQLGFVLNAQGAEIPFVRTDSGSKGRHRGFSGMPDIRAGKKNSFGKAGM